MQACFFPKQLYVYKIYAIFTKYHLSTSKHTSLDASKKFIILLENVLEYFNNLKKT